jgi:N-acyl homoserine lactone hydrolase
MQTWSSSSPGAKILELGDAAISGEHMGCGPSNAGRATTLAGVKVRADAIPLEGPLPGGSDGAAVVVEPMEAGRAHWAPEFFEYPRGVPLGRLRAKGRVSESTVPCPAFLVRHPGVGPILIDTGLHPSVATDPRHNLGRTLGRFFELEHGGDVVSQLRGKSIAPDDVAVVILTHLHADHASAISEFPESIFVLSAEEWKQATTGSRSTLNGYRRSHYDHAFDYRTVDFDAEAISSYGQFGRSFDLLGDGSVRLVYTPGHTAGHMSVILRLPRRDFVVAGDAVYTWRQLEGGPEPAHSFDDHNWRRSQREVLGYHRAYPYAVIVPGHDPELWSKLEDRYEE